VTNIVHLKDAEPISTSFFRFGKYSFDEFNPVQSAIFPIREDDCNAVIAAKTSAGKTILSELFASHGIFNEDKSMIYLAPLRSLVTEKKNDWTNPSHPFSNLKLSVLSGDYKYTDDKIDEINDSQIIIMTCEMLNHRIRNHASKKSQYLKNCHTMVVDEAHLLTVEGRGDHLETALMKFTKENPSCRILLLSATMSNTVALAEWLHKLNGKKTYILESEYRPQPLDLHFIPISDSGTLEDQLKLMYEESLELCRKYENDKFLIFTHTKKMGNYFVSQLRMRGIESYFHNADLEMDKRSNIEQRFKSKTDNLRVIVATSTLAWGVSLPARRVIIVGMRRGKDFVENYDIQQMVGRAGRKGLDPRGDAYIFVPYSCRKQEEDRIKSPCKINSQILKQKDGTYENLAFHILGEFAKQKMFTISDVNQWYSRSFSSFENNFMRTAILEETIEKLCDHGALKEKDGNYSITKLGEISIHNYLCPFVVSRYKKNFNNLFTKQNSKSAINIAYAFANVETYLKEYMKTEEKTQIFEFVSKFKSIFGNDVPDGIIKMTYLFNGLLKNEDNLLFQSTVRTIKKEIDRTVEIIKQIDERVCKWKKDDELDEILYQIKYSAPPHLRFLVKIPNIGIIRAEKLYQAGFTNAEQIRTNIEKASKIAGCKIVL
jgi:helicase